MAVYTEICEYLRVGINSLHLYADAVIGSMPAENGISLYTGAGTATDTYFDKGSVNDLFVTVNAKHSSNQTALNALSAIHTHFCRLKTYGSGADWQIANIETATAPNYIEQDDRGQYAYGSILRVTFFIKGVN